MINLKSRTVSVVLSFYNEEEVLEELVRRLRNIFQGTLKNLISQYELIFVDDNSTDRSKEILVTLAKDYNDIKIIRMSRNFGVSQCVLAGMEYASGDAVIYMDADLQDPPEVIPIMVNHWTNEGVDVVHTKRISRKGEPRLKLWVTRLAYKIIRIFSDIAIESEVGDFKLLSKRVVDQVIRFRENKPFIRGIVNWVGFEQKTIEYKREPRYAGETKYPFYGRRVILNFLDSALISFSSIPLRIGLFLGFLVSLGAFIYLVLIFVMKYLGINIPGWSAIMATLLVLGGIQLLTIGIIGLYLNEIFLESKHRPNYIVKETYGFETD